MLNEAYVLLRALTQSKIPIPRKHKRVTSPGQTSGDCLRVRLDQQGDVVAIESVTRTEWPGVWTVMDGRQNSFPVVRLKKAVFALPDNSDLWAELGYDAEGKRPKQSLPPNDKRLEIYEKVLSDSKCERKAECGFWKRLSSKAADFLEYSQPANREFASLCRFAERFQQASKDPGRLLRQTAEKAVRHLKNGRLDAFDEVETLLVGKKPKPKDKTEEKGKIAFQLAFDVDDENSSECVLFSKRMRDYVSGILPQDRPERKGKKSQDGNGTGICAYEGNAVALEAKVFPTVRLPVLNKDFPLVSMFSFAKCNKRYGLTDAQVVPVGRDLAMRMKEALEWIVQSERKGKTWRGVASGKFEMRNDRKVEKPDLLIVYVEGRPVIDANVADFFGRDEDQVERQFEVDAQTICSALDGVDKELPGSKINLFLLRKVSEGQAKVVKADSITVENLLRAATNWQVGANANLPDLIVPRLLPKEKGQKTIPGRILSPYPDQVVRLLQYQWVRDGSSPISNGKRQKPHHEVEGIGLGIVIEIMLRTEGKLEPSVRNVLDLLLRRVGPMLIGLGGAMRGYVKKSGVKKHQRLDDYDRKAREDYLCAISVLGILLDAFGRRKERYMNDSAFLVGRLFALADTLHKQYCVVVRDGSIPASLIGNSSLPRGFDNPQLAIADLAERIRIYVGWAQTAADPAANDREQENKLIAVRTARKTLSRYKPLAEQLHKTGLPERCDDVMKAEMLLGYLASEKGMDNDKETDNE